MSETLSEHERVQRITAEGRPDAFRFGVVAPVMASMSRWRDQVKQVADQGYAAVLMPDVPGLQPSPAPALAIASTVADVQVGSWVHASALRPAQMLAHEAHSMTTLTEGRFELGIGTGRPGIDELTDALGQPRVGPLDRLERVRETIRTLRDLDGETCRTPVIMAVRGPRARSLALELADAATFSITAGDRRQDVERLARSMRAVRPIPLALHVPVVGDVVAPFMAGPGTRPADLREADSLMHLPAEPAAAVEELLRRREECGFSYIVIGAAAAATFAPVVARLAGT